MRMRGNGIKEYMHNTYNNPKSEIFLAYVNHYFNNPIPYDEFFAVYRNNLVGEHVFLPYYSLLDERRKIYEGREAYVVDIEYGLLQCLLVKVKRKTTSGRKIELDEELTVLTPSLFFEFQREYYRHYRKKGKLTDSQYKNIISKKYLIQYCYEDFIKLANQKEY